MVAACLPDRAGLSLTSGRLPASPGLPCAGDEDFQMLMLKMSEFRTLLGCPLKIPSSLFAISEQVCATTVQPVFCAVTHETEP